MLRHIVERTIRASATADRAELRRLSATPKAALKRMAELEEPLP